MKKYRIELTMACLLLVCFYLLSRQAAVISVNQTERGAQKAAGPLILVDAGHGGSDPGMIGVGGLEEKGINLSISLLLRDTLEKSGYSVIMTREEDKGGTLVIVECGFLTNPEEAQKLQTKEYQEKVAAAVSEGIRTYLNAQ